MREVGTPGPGMKLIFSYTSKAPLLAENAENGAPADPSPEASRNPHTNVVTFLPGEHWAGHEAYLLLHVKSPTSRKGREKWGTRRPLSRSIRRSHIRMWSHFYRANIGPGLKLIFGCTSKSPTSRKGREKWGTRLRSRVPT